MDCCGGRRLGLFGVDYEEVKVDFWSDSISSLGRRVGERRHFLGNVQCMNEHTNKCKSASSEQN